ncbi:MAG: hypothetical protein ACR2PL_26520 [Dehalococcoidia bacterium]
MIKGFLDLAYPLPIPFVQVGLHLPDTGGQVGSVGFLIDRGAATMGLHPIRP